MAATSQLAQRAAGCRPCFDSGGDSTKGCLRSYAVKCPQNFCKQWKQGQGGSQKERLFSARPLGHHPTVRCAVASTEAPVSTEAESKTLQDKRRFVHATQPWFSRETVLRTEADGIWTLTQPFQLGLGQFSDARLRAAVVRLSDGSLWVHSPVALTEECLELVQSLGGPVSHIVIPNTSPEHRFFSDRWAQQFPDARVWAPLPAWQKTGESVGRSVEVLQPNAVPSAWGDAFEAVTFSTGTGEFTESVFLHRRQKAIFVADLLLWVEDDQLPSALNKAITKSINCYKQLGMVPLFRLAMNKHPQAAKAFAQTLLAMDFSTIYFSHGTASARVSKEDVRRVYKDYLELGS